MKISIIGLGPVGSTTAICFAKLGHKVIGVDIIKSRIDKIIKIGKESKTMLFGALDIKEAILNSDISFICVETPSKKNGELDLTALRKVCKQVGEEIKNKEHYHMIVIRSTMFPGSFEILKDILEKSSGKKSGKDFDIALNPEFLREKYAIKDFFNPSFIIIGTKKRETAGEILKCYKGIKAKKFLVDMGIAQMIKYMNNSYHALKVSYINEISDICKKLKINDKKLAGLFCEDTQLNISPYYFKPGNAWGGHCLGKDLLVLQNHTKKLKINCSVINSISKSNEEHKKRIKNA